MTDNQQNGPALRMLVFDPAYTYRIMKERGLFSLVTGRDLDGYFDHIWTVHPVATLLEPEDSPDRFGKPQSRDIAPLHTHIEGRVGKYNALRRLQIGNFLFAQLELLRALMGLVKTQNIRIVRSEEPLYGGLFALLLSRLYKLPLVIGLWGNPEKGRKQSGVPMMPRLFKRIWVEEIVEAFVLRRADLIVVQCDDEREFAIRKGVDPAHIAIFEMTNALEQVHWQDIGARGDGGADLRQLGVEEGDTLLCVSRLRKVKLVDHAVRVVRLLKDRDRRVTLILAGEGGDRSELGTLAQELGVADQIVFAGNRSQAWLSRVIPAVSAVLSPYTGRALAETSLGAAPTVAYDVDWHSQFITTGETGELVPFHDVAAMAAATERLLAHRDHARWLGANLRQRALALLDPGVARCSQIAAYEQLLQRSAEGRSRGWGFAS